MNLGTGHLVDARRLIEAQRANPMGTAAYGYAMLGDTAAAMKIVRQMESAKPRPPWSAEVQRATVMLAMGDSAGAPTALEHSAQAPGPLWVWVISPRDPAFDLVKQSKRFAALVRQAGMDTAWVTARTPQ